VLDSCAGRGIIQCQPDPIVQRLGHRPFTAVTRVRIPLGSLSPSATYRKNVRFSDTFLTNSAVEAGIDRSRSSMKARVSAKRRGRRKPSAEVILVQSGSVPTRHERPLRLDVLTMRNWNKSMNAFSEGEIMRHHDLMVCHAGRKAGRPYKSVTEVLNCRPFAPHACCTSQARSRIRRDRPSGGIPT
jgi:hypothetical protein